MNIREYQPQDIQELSKLFYETVHTVNARDYTPEQRDAWAPGWVDEKAWDASFRRHRTLIAEEDGVILGFADMDETGYLDRLYVHKDAQGRGIATALCDALETGSKADRWTVHASITAKPFFESRGYRTVREQQVERRGVILTNFLMVKDSEQ